MDKQAVQRDSQAHQHVQQSVGRPSGAGIDSFADYEAALLVGLRDGHVRVPKHARVRAVPVAPVHGRLARARRLGAHRLASVHIDD